MTRTIWTRICLWAATVAVAIAVQMLYAAPGDSMFWGVVFDAGHAPLFGVVALAFLQGLLLFPWTRSLPRPWIYAAALALAIGSGGMAEFGQHFGPRDADPQDLARDALGAMSALLAAYGIDRRATKTLRGLRIPRAAFAGAALLVLVPVILPVARITYDLLQRDRAFPEICEFNSAWEGRFLHLSHATLERVPPPPGWVREERDRDAQPAGSGPRGAGDLVAHLTFYAAAYPALLITEPHPDWSGYDRLAFDVYSELPVPIRLALRIHDTHHERAYSDRFNLSFTIQPGVNAVAIDLSQVEHAPRGRLMDMQHIHNVTLFAVRPAESISLYLDSFRLERD
ncbi:MAG: hypothetical protein V1774_08845 [Candidatus Eisenbacteria bacterium]